MPRPAAGGLVPSSSGSQPCLAQGGASVSVSPECYLCPFPSDSFLTTGTQIPRAVVLLSILLAQWGGVIFQTWCRFFSCWTGVIPLKPCVLVSFQEQRCLTRSCLDGCPKSFLAEDLISDDCLGTQSL